jgi:hypothetical protein
VRSQSFGFCQPFTVVLMLASPVEAIKDWQAGA